MTVVKNLEKGGMRPAKKKETNITIFTWRGARALSMEWYPDERRRVNRPSSYIAFSLTPSHLDLGKEGSLLVCAIRPNGRCCGARTETEMKSSKRKVLETKGGDERISWNYWRSNLKGHRSISTAMGSDPREIRKGSHGEPKFPRARWQLMFLSPIFSSHSLSKCLTSSQDAVS